MAEINKEAHQRPRSSPAEYINQVAPYIRNKAERDRWMTVEKNNKTMHKKLEAIRREPPNNFHAPNGYASIKDGRKAKKKEKRMPESQMAGTNIYLDVVQWPPGIQEPCSSRQRSSRMDAVKKENQRIHNKLISTYRSANNKSVGTSVDYAEKWAIRTNLYETTGMRQASPQKSIPKTLGVASCAGCGVKSFFNADGPQLFPCSTCQQVWYCSNTCASMDYTSHKQVCKYHAHGQWTPGGSRSRDEYWVCSTAMAAARKLLKNKHALGLEDEADEQEFIAQHVGAVKKKEAAAEQLQRMIEKQAYDGLEGPRPCMYIGGRPVGSLDKRSLRVDQKMLPQPQSSQRNTSHIVRHAGMDAPMPT